MHAYRSHTCDALNTANVGETVRLSGWVHRVRDHGGVLFLDLRDHYGITQVIADSDSPAFAAINALRAEWVVCIDGWVKARDASLVNPKLATGTIEVYATGLTVLGAAEELPVPVFGDVDYPEETRLTYRFLDLRREKLHRNMMLRSNVVRSMRNRMWDQGFNEFQTPIITASSPEGARDFLVPSRLHPGKFYALPQAPQQFKQLIMVAGFDRYFQIAPCFRDEDPRADRSPTDFYQLDIEMSFVEQEDVFAAVQPVIQGIFEEFAPTKTVHADWPLITWGSSMRAFGTDKPDLRNPIIMASVTDVFRGSGFGIFAKMIENDSAVQVWAIAAPRGGSRKFCDRMNAWAQREGQPGLGYIFWRDENGICEGAGPVAKNLGPDRTELLRKFREDNNQAWVRFEPVRGSMSGMGFSHGIDQQVFDSFDASLPNGLGAGDAMFFIAGVPSQIAAFAGRARTEIGRELKLTEENCFRFAWIVDFPMYEKTDDGRIDFSHNPFSMPQGGLDALNGDPLKVYAYQYDLACNGYELISGGIRNHKPEIMFKAFELAGYPASEVEKRFGGMVKAFKYGAPPHGGCAAGIDRIVMLLADEANIREVIMFPMNQRAEDLLMGAPSEPLNAQLRELNLRVVPKDA